MITLYSYPELSGVADNNGYGLKVFAFLKLAGVDFTQEHSSTLPQHPAANCPTLSMPRRRSATVIRLSLIVPPNIA